MTVQTTTRAALPTGGLALAGPIESGAPGLQVLRDWVEAASNAAQLVGPLVDSAFVPDAYKPRTNPNASPEEWAQARQVAVSNATSAVLLGMSIGIDPLTALQNIYIVHGRPGMYTKLKVALAHAAGHRVWDEVYGPERAVVCGQRRGTDDVVRIEITIDDAKRAGWTSNAAYLKTPADMLWARAASRVVDRIAADVLHGIASIEDIDERPTVDADVTTKRVTRAEILGTPAAAADPVVEAPSRERPPGPGPIDDKTWQRINSRFVDLGVTGPGQAAKRLKVITDIVEHDVTRGSELDEDEGRLVLDQLTAWGRSQIRDILAPVQPEQDVDEQTGDQVVDEVDGDYDPTADPDWTGGGE